MSQAGPRDVESVLADRYWITDKGWLAALAIEHQQDQPQEAHA